MYLNKPPFGTKYPFLIFRRLINLLSLEIFIYRPNTNNKKPVIKNIDTECKLILLKKYPFINPFTILKKKNQMLHIKIGHFYNCKNTLSELSPLIWQS